MWHQYAFVNANELVLYVISRAFCETIRMTFGVCVCVCVCVCVYVCVCVSRAYHLVLLDGF